MSVTDRELYKTSQLPESSLINLNMEGKPEVKFQDGRMRFNKTASCSATIRTTNILGGGLNKTNIMQHFDRMDFWVITDRLKPCDQVPGELTAWV